MFLVNCDETLIQFGVVAIELLARGVLNAGEHFQIGSSIEEAFVAELEGLVICFEDGLADLILDICKSLVSQSLLHF